MVVNKVGVFSPSYREKNLFDLFYLSCFCLHVLDFWFIVFNSIPSSRSISHIYLRYHPDYSYALHLSCSAVTIWALLSPHNFFPALTLLIVS